MPERAFDMEQFLLDVKKTYDRLGCCVIAVSEGIQDKDGTPIMTKLMSCVEKDAHGNVQLSGTGMLGDLLAEEIKNKLKISRVRSDTFGYLQRSFFGCVSDVDQHEAREVGERAVQYALWHNMDGSVVMERTGFYSVDYRLAPLADVAGKTRHMPDEFINSAGNHVTDAFKFYLRPLLGSGLGSATHLRAPKAEKILKKNI